MNRGAYVHCRTRFMERFGQSLSEETFHDINDLIITGAGEFVCALEGGRELWRLRIDKDNLCVVFEPDAGVAVTFLSNSMAMERAKRNGVDLRPKPLQSRVEQLEAQVDKLTKLVDQLKSRQQTITIDEAWLDRVRQESVDDYMYKLQLEGAPVVDQGELIASVVELRQFFQTVLGTPMPEVSAFRRQVNKLAGMNYLPAETNARGHLQFYALPVRRFLERNRDAVKEWAWHSVKP